MMSEERITQVKQRISEKFPGWQIHVTNQQRWWATGPGMVVPAMAMSPWFFDRPEQLERAIERAIEAKKKTKKA